MQRPPMNLPESVTEILLNGTNVERFAMERLRCCEDRELVLDEVARWILESAVKKLPKIWPWHVTSSNETRYLSLAELLSKWRNSSDGVRLEIARHLSEVFCPRRNSQDTASLQTADPIAESTSIDRVLPELYGEWIIEHGVDNRPNCLGKFQLLVAFGRLLSAPVLSISTIMSHIRLANQYKYELAKSTLDFFDSYGLSLSEEHEQVFVAFSNLSRTFKSMILFNTSRYLFAATEENGMSLIRTCGSQASRLKIGNLTCDMKL